MLPKADLWPKYFNTSEATTDDIELFFFPKATQGFSSRLLVPNMIQSGMIHQTHDNVLTVRDVVNDRDPIEVDAQVVTDELGKDKRIKRRNAKLDDYV
ncbi:hypothetical protein R3W88_010616 [Solanum pinnatisectum]|uniref:AIPP2-like SPOC-like domain-containing protein n=1 Tax=Solanum pinnatisectum TaxID=50273 RepID=A0AAV9L4J0_9SOLN|nr:hypothetical protein R3W88_010616 [Solanum pinnatisectum]